MVKTKSKFYVDLKGFFMKTIVSHGYILLLILQFSFGFYFQTVEAQSLNRQKIDQVEQGVAKEACVSWWGYDSEDSTTILQAALNSKAVKIIVDKQAGPWITKTLTIPSNKEIILAEGVEILAKKGEFHGISDPLLNITQVCNITIRGEGKGGILRMRKADYHTDAYKKAEWRHGINIKSSDHITIENITIASTGGDGIYLGVAKRGVPCSNIVIRKVVCDDNNRQGISVISAENLLIEDTVLKNTIGTAPESGIDFEPNSKTEKLVNCVMRNCLCENNAGDGFQFYLPNLDRTSGPASITLENCISRNNKRCGFSLSVGNGPVQSLDGFVKVKNFTSENDGNCIEIRSKAANALDMIFENATLIAKKSVLTDSAQKAIPRSPINISSRIMDEDPIGKFTFDNISIKYSGNQPVLKFSDTTVNGSGLSDVKGKLIVDNDGKKSTIILNDEWCRQNYPDKVLRKIKSIKPEEVKQIPFGLKIDKDSVFRPRSQAEFLFYAEKGQRVELALQQYPVGRIDPCQGQVVITSSSGHKTSFPLKAVFKEPTVLKWIAPETGIHSVSADLGMRYALSLVRSNVPTAISAYPYLRLVYSTGTFYFNVPENTKEFAVKATGENMERVKITLFSPDGKEKWCKDNIESVEFYYSEEGKTPDSGLWKIKVERPSEGVLEDFSIGLLGLPPYLHSSSEQKIIPTKK